MLPCGAGKTLVGAAAMARAQATTLILVTNTVSARQWKSELVRRTSLTEDEIGEYSGAKKEIRPVTIATYQVLTMRRKGVYPHLELLDAKDWGLIVYDEVHLLPGPDLPDDRRPPGASPDRPDRDARARGRPRGRRVQPDRPQAVRRPVEGHREPGLDRARPTASRCGSPCPRASGSPTPPPSPRSATGWPAAPTPRCSSPSSWSSSTAGEPTLVIGQYLDQLDELAEHLDAPGDQGRHHGQGARAALRGLPDRRGRPAGRLQGGELLRRPARAPRSRSRSAGRFGSRQEEAQRLGRLLRPKEKGPDGTQKPARFYTIVSRDTVDADFAQNRQRFLAEQGYAYRIVDAADL